MDPGELNLKKCSKISLAALGVLLVYAILFFRERLFFADASFVAFNIINSKSLAIQDQRLGSFLTEMVPYLGQNLNLPIGYILFGYAISFNLLFVSVAALLIFRYKQSGLAIIMSLYFFLFVSDSFFWTNDEVHQAIALMFLFFAITIYLGKKQVNILIVLMPFLLLLFLTIATHFAAIITTVFLWVYLIIENKNWPFSKKETVALSCFIVLIIACHFVFSVSRKSYDSEYLHGLTHFSLKDIIFSFSTPVVKMFLYRCLINYWVAIVVFAAGIVSLLKKRQTKLAAWTFVSFVGYFIIMGLTNGNFDKNRALFHVETEWASIGIIAATPFVLSFLPTLKAKHGMSVLAVIFLIRLGYISAAYPAFHWRIQFQEQILAQMKKKGITKLAMYDDAPVNKKWILSWGFPFESILTSAMNGDTIQRTFAFINRHDIPTTGDIQNSKNIYVVFGMMAPDQINHQYFNLDTIQPYRIMEYAEFMK